MDKKLFSRISNQINQSIEDYNQKRFKDCLSNQKLEADEDYSLWNATREL